MRRVSTAAGRSRARDEVGRFVSQSNPRARSRPIEDRCEEDSESQIGGLREEARADGAEDGSDVEAACPQHQRVSESENYRIAFEDEETVLWGDVDVGCYGLERQHLGSKELMLRVQAPTEAVIKL
jgi:hypothetical protein